MPDSIFICAGEKNRECKIMRKGKNNNELSGNGNNKVDTTGKHGNEHKKTLDAAHLGMWITKKFFWFFFHPSSSPNCQKQWPPWLAFIVCVTMRTAFCLSPPASKVRTSRRHVHPHMKRCAEARTLTARWGQYPPQLRRSWHKQTRTARWLKKLPANNAKWKDINI